MSKYKAIALDIDGTLINSKKEITPRVLQKIQKLQEKGVAVIIASGRPPHGIAHVAKALGMDRNGGYVSAFNGGKIIEFQTGEVKYQATVPEELRDEIIRYAHTIPESTILLHGDGVIYTEDDTNEYARFESDIVRMPLKKVEDLHEVIDYPANKYLITGNPELMPEYSKKMAKHFEGRLNIMQSAPFFIEVIPPGVDKAESLAKLIAMLGIKREELVACGDGENDLGMIRYAGLGVAMENGEDCVKEAADFVTTSCENDGVANVIEKFMED